MSASELLYAAHVPGGAGPFPTVILLHGWGANAHDLLGLAPMIHDGGALVLCPQGPVAVPIGGGHSGYGWFPLVPGVPPDPEAFFHGAKLLREFVEQCRERYPMDPQATVVGGFSQGGAMAFYLALSDPVRYAGLAALSTYLPSILIEQLPRLPEQEGLPVLVIHGTADPAVDVERAREAREALRAFKVNLMYREFDMGHEIRPEALRVVIRWLEDRAWSPAAQSARPKPATIPAAASAADAVQP
jgi:phospholipase/carboxylesterase